MKCYGQKSEPSSAVGEQRRVKDEMFCNASLSPAALLLLLGVLGLSVLQREEVA